MNTLIQETCYKQALPVTSLESNPIVLEVGNSSEILDTSQHIALSKGKPICTAQLQFALRGKLNWHRLQVGTPVDRGGRQPFCLR